MTKILLALLSFLCLASSYGKVHVFKVWDGYFTFLQSSETIYLGDTIQWLPAGGGAPSMYHTITSESIPEGAIAFDEPWQAPADTFFQYVPEVAGTYDYVCTPHKTSHNMVGSFVVESVLGEEKITKGEVSYVYPNPANYELQISQELIGSEYIVYDILGLPKMAGNMENTLDITSLDIGRYILVTSGKVQRTIRFTKY